jgi:hypothetical protein
MDGAASNSYLALIGWSDRVRSQQRHTVLRVSDAVAAAVHRLRCD